MCQRDPSEGQKLKTRGQKKENRSHRMKENPQRRNCKETGRKHGRRVWTPWLGRLLSGLGEALVAESPADGGSTEFVENVFLWFGGVPRDRKEGGHSSGTGHQLVFGLRTEVDPVVGGVGGQRE